MFANLAGGLAARGLTCQLVLVRDHGPRAVEPPTGVGVVDLRAPIVHDAAFASALPALVRYLRATRPRVLYAGITTINLMALTARRLSRTDTAVVVSEHVPVSINARTSPLKRLLPPLVRRAYRDADAVVAVSGALADDLARVSGLPRERIAVLANPVVTAEHLAAARERPDHPWLCGETPVVLGVGRLAAQKDFPTLVTALDLLRRRGEGRARAARLIVLGEGEARPALESLVERLGLGEAVAFPGHVRSPAPYLAHADLFVLSSRFEGLPTALIEALACGCPSVSTDCPTGPREILDGGRYGELVAVGDAPALAEAMERTLLAPPERERLREHGRRFSVEAAVEEVLPVLEAARSLSARRRSAAT